MAVLGLAIQSHTGIPLYLESWSGKLRAFHEGNPILISGFLAALNSFAHNYHQDIGYIRFHPTDFPDDPYGIDGIYTFIGEFMILCFTDPYQFHRQVHNKMQWIYSKVLFQYEDMIRVGKVPDLTDQEQRFIYDILMDSYAYEYIFAKREQLTIDAEKIMVEEYPEDIFGCCITSFDNTILFQHGMTRDEIETYLNNIGSKGADLQDGEILHNYVPLPGLEPRLVVMSNPGVKLQISDILEDIAGEGAVPFYYYLITDANCTIGPIVESLFTKFNSVLI
ncbi:MAG: hypothetical protein ACFFD2_30005 [Promethearchaeota archaeon]